MNAIPAPSPRAAKVTAVPIRLWSVIALIGATLCGIAAFCWPLLVAPDSPLAQQKTAPWLFAMILPIVLAVGLAHITDQGMDAKAVAMLGVLTAVGAAIRPLGAGTGGVETVFVLLVLGGRVFGPGFGFILGNTTLFASALLTGGVGPWLPYQMLAAGWFGLAAGLLPQIRGWLEYAMLACYGVLASLLFGVLMNLSFWPFALGPHTELSFIPGAPVTENLQRLLAFSLATSLGWDIGRAITTAVLILLTGPIVLRTLRRAARKASFQPADSC
jgi:energy-coupling factor transport system substrate-specific component